MCEIGYLLITIWKQHIAALLEIRYYPACVEVLLYKVKMFPQLEVVWLYRAMQELTSIRGLWGAQQVWKCSQSSRFFLGKLWLLLCHLIQTIPPFLRPQAEEADNNALYIFGSLRIVLHLIIVQTSLLKRLAILADTSSVPVVLPLVRFFKCFDE